MTLNTAGRTTMIRRFSTFKSFPSVSAFSFSMRSAVLLLSMFILGLSCGSTAHADLDSKMSKAIDKATEWLLTASKEVPTRPGGHAGEGLLALETYALIVAGVDVGHPTIKKNLKRLAKNVMNHTYTVSCIIFALDAAINQIHGDIQFLSGKPIPDSPKIGRKHRRVMEKAVKALLNMKHSSSGKWTYGGSNGTNFDNSNVQFAVLGLGAGANRGIPVSDEVWEHIALHFIESQQEKGDEVTDRIVLKPKGDTSEIEIVDEDGKKIDTDKKKEKKGRTRKKTTRTAGDVDPIPVKEGKVYSRGWKYNAGGGHGGYNLNMTNAGVSSLLLARENLFRKMDKEFEQKLNTSIRDGLGFLMKNWNIHQTGAWEYYALYSLEKTGDIGHIKKFGSHDWFDEVANKIVDEQDRDGSWPGNFDQGDVPETVRRRTAFALLILNRASSLLTARSRSDRMVLTGPGAHSADRANRDSWVYLQDLDREIHIPSLFRTVRLRPNPKLIRFVDAAVKDFPIDKKGLLLPFLYKSYKSYKSAKSDKIKKALRENMTSITGVDYKKTSRYMVWYRRWRDVEKIGSDPKTAKDHLGYLLKYYKNTPNSLALRKRIIWALTHCRSKKAAPLFIEDLDHEDPEVRLLAYDALQFVQFASPPPPFDGKAKKDTRKQQVKAIQDWFEQFAG